MIKFTLMAAGYCTHPEFITIRGGRWRSVPFPALFALLEHSQAGPTFFIKFTLMAAGSWNQPQFINIRRRRWPSVPFPALFALPEPSQAGPILFDTGYTGRFFSETRRFPASLYARLTPVHFNEVEAACRQL